MWLIDFVKYLLDILDPGLRPESLADLLQNFLRLFPTYTHGSRLQHYALKRLKTITFKKNGFFILISKIEHAPTPNII